MRLTRLAGDAVASRDGLVMDLMAAIGSDDFADRLIGAVSPALPANHCTVFALQDNGRVQVVSTASVIGDAASDTARAYARMGFDRQDANMVWLAARKPARQIQYWLGHQFAEEVANEQYRRVCYGENGIRERLSLLVLYPDGYRVAISFYRNHSYADFAEADLAWLRGVSRLIAAAVRRHVHQRPGTAGTGSTAAVPEQQRVELPRRERELLAHILDGCTTREAAERMGVAHTTALTYRYRAFARLDVRNQRELLSRLHLQAGGGGGLRP
ncbi:LuxR C-terminal-related transcriptional regulator [Comamonadaceae bacterium G21597-S1]|nr:LuxR C-terminal-related transcriptional regulator [Comamonadaceae bacterium G21597-S1]